MITKYLVKEVSVATDENPSERGTSVGYSGKGGYLFGRFDWATQKIDNSRIWARDVIEHGFARPQDAKRSWEYKNPNNNKFWKLNVYIVPVVLKEVTGIDDDYIVTELGNDKRDRGGEEDAKT